MKTHSGKTSAGFTLVELIIIIGIITILATVAIPQLGPMLSSSRTTAQYNQIITTLNLARSEAVKRNQRIRLCAGSTDSCTNTDWEDGWVVLAPNTSGNDTILQAIEPLSPGYTLRLSESSSATQLEYRANGTLGNTIGTFTLCDDTGQASRAKAVNLNLMGQPGRARDTDGDGTVEDVKENNVGCP